MPVSKIHTEMMKGTWFIATSPPTVKWIARSKKWGSTPDLLKLAEIEKAANSWQMKSRNPPSSERTRVCDHPRPQRDYLLYRNETRRSRTRQPRQNHEGEVRYKARKMQVKIGNFAVSDAHKRIYLFTQHLGRVQFTRYKARKSRGKWEQDRSTVV